VVAPEAVVATGFESGDGQRKANCVGTREAAEEVRRQLEARFTLVDLGLLSEGKQVPTFADYAQGRLTGCETEMQAFDRAQL